VVLFPQSQVVVSGLPNFFSKLVWWMMPRAPFAVNVTKISLIFFLIALPALPFVPNFL
jgi:hypothetical protein